MSSEMTAPGGFLNYYTSGKLSDLVITCGDRKFYVHKIILCGRSNFFATMMEGGWKEVTEGVVDLNDEDPDFVDAMLRFLYTLDYDSTGMVSSGNRLNTVLNAVKVYGIADRFDIPQLRDAAKLHVASSPLSEEFEDDRLACIIDTVYNTTPSSDRGLRDVITIAASHGLKKRLRTPAFRALLETADGFAADIAQLLAQKQPHGVVKRYKCPSCSGTWEGAVEHGQEVSCMFCGSSRSDWHSYVQEDDEEK